MTLAEAMLARLDGDAALKHQHRRIYRIVSDPNTPAHRQWLSVAEHAVRQKYDIPNDAPVDWNTVSIDWILVLKIFVGLLSILVLFL